MGSPMQFVVVAESGQQIARTSSWLARELEPIVLGGAELTLRLIDSLAEPRHPGRYAGWYVSCEAGVLADLRSRVLLVFAIEGPLTIMSHRRAGLELLREQWPGWQVRWAYGGLAQFRAYLGMEPEVDAERVFGCPFVGPDQAEEEELAEPHSLGCVVTVDHGSSYVAMEVNEHPVAQGPSLLQLLAEAPPYPEAHIPARSGLHLDAVHRRVAWWTQSYEEDAHLLGLRWPGWDRTFWGDDWQAHVRASGGLFRPPAYDDRATAKAELASWTAEFWEGYHFD